MSGSSNPPSTSGSQPIVRRALTTSMAAVAAIGAPVGLVAATAGSAPGSANGGAAEWAAEVDTVRSQSDGEASLFLAANPADPIVIDLPATSTTVAPTTTTVAPTTTAPPPPPAPTPAPAPTAGSGDPNDPASWDRLAQCESGGNWATNTGNGYYGGIQFSLASWQGVGGTGYPHEHSREVQIEMGKRLWAQGGWKHWPACTRSFGWR